MGDRGRVVVPAEVRERHHLDPGTPLILVESPDGLVLMTRDQLERRVQTDLSGFPLVDELLAERREAATVEDNS